MWLQTDVLVPTFPLDCSRHGRRAKFTFFSETIIYLFLSLEAVYFFTFSQEFFFSFGGWKCIVGRREWRKWEMVSVQSRLCLSHSPIPSLERGTAAGVSPVRSRSSLLSTGREPWWSRALFAHVKLAPCLGTPDRVASWSLTALDTTCLQIKVPDFQIPCFFFVLFFFPYYYLSSTFYLHLLHLPHLLLSFPLLCNKGLFPVRRAKGEYARLQRLSEASPAGRGFFPRNSFSMCAAR